MLAELAEVLFLKIMKLHLVLYSIIQKYIKYETHFECVAQQDHKN